MAAVSIHSDFGAQENKVSHCFHCFPIYLPWSAGPGCHDSSFLLCWVLSPNPPHVCSLAWYPCSWGLWVPLYHCVETNLPPFLPAPTRLWPLSSLPSFPICYRRPGPAPSGWEKMTCKDLQTEKTLNDVSPGGRHGGKGAHRILALSPSQLPVPIEPLRIFSFFSILCDLNNHTSSLGLSLL